VTRHNLSMTVHRTSQEVAEIIERFLDGTGGRWDWDDFCSLRIDDPALDAVRIRCVDLHDEDPDPFQYCGPSGTETLRGLVSSLRKA
jgi:hypothetical protein